ncbi:MAG TPA: NrfD/PsrC family molybdoenzyme membrane anchor subunit [Fimbriimonadaceae bacterium]|nr:NrfD/PsrC family molybdoenzyme membrane anchor subunit [Fimbriimonadaceae bacterium]
MVRPDHPQFELLIEGDQTYSSIDQKIGNVVLDQRRHKKPWYAVIFVAFLLVNLLLVSVGWLLYQGIGIWGNNIPTGWAFDIINFVWWIGIGHAGTLISAILLLMRQQWRNSINRFAEAMTLFAVMCAGMYPLLHTGRPWVAYWLFPYPNIMAVWPQFRSPLVWDVFAVSTYFTASILFWYVGLIPDLATLRDKSTNRAAKVVFAMLSMGWRGANKHWHRYEQAYLLLAALSTPLVLSVHSIVSLDFAVAVVPGWNITVFPPYFVAGAVYAGFAMVLLVAIPIRKVYGWKELITMNHIDWMAKIMLATGLIVAYGYVLEAFYGWYAGTSSETALLNWRFSGPYKYDYWALILCNVIIPQLMWVPKLRRNLPVVWIVCISVSVGMWLERFVIIPMSLMRNYLPSSDYNYYPTKWDYFMFAGTIGFFFFMMWLFIRFLPVINMFEIKDLLHKMKGESAKADREALAPAGGGE